MSGTGHMSGTEHTSGTAPHADRITPGEIERIVAGIHHDPHSVLGAHPGPGGVRIRALLPMAATVAVVLPDGPRAGHDAARDTGGHPLPVPAHARPDRPASDRRGQAREPVAGARRARSYLR